jgi:amidase
MRKAVLLREHRDLLKPEVIWNIEKGHNINFDELERAENMRVTLAQRYLAFFDKYDLLLTPATVVAPFPIENRYVAEVNGHKFANYVEWLAIAYAITVSCGTALSLPCGFTRENLPVGLQIAGPPRNEARILSAAKGLEDILGLRGTTPIDPRIAAA